MGRRGNRYGLAPTLFAPDIDGDEEGLLILADAVALAGGGLVSLRALLHLGLELMPSSGALALRLAHLELTNGHRREAYAAARRAPDFPGMAILRAQLEPPRRKSAARASALPSSAHAFIENPYEGVGVEVWQQFPCNFYSFHYSLIDDATIKLIVDDANTENNMYTLLAAPPAPATRSGEDGPSERPMEAESRTLLYGFDTSQDLDDSDYIPPEPKPPIDVGVESLGENVSPAQALTLQVMDCFKAWNRGLSDFDKGWYSRAIENIQSCQNAIQSYLRARIKLNTDVYPSAGDTVYERLINVALFLLPLSGFQNYFGQSGQTTGRTNQVTVDTLYNVDWLKPRQNAGGANYYTTCCLAAPMSPHGRSDHRFHAGVLVTSANFFFPNQSFLFQALAPAPGYRIPGILADRWNGIRNFSPFWGTSWA